MSKPSKPPSRQWTLIEDTGDFHIFRDDHVVKVRLTRSGNGNALNSNMIQKLTELFKSLKDDKSVFHVVISSEGKFFCTGMDLRGATQGGNNDFSFYGDALHLFDAISSLPQTTIAAIHGPCFGGGVGLSFVCDIRLATTEACWCLGEVKLGVCPALVSKYVLREWGPAVAREAILTGRELTAQKLHGIGVIHGLAETHEELKKMLEDYLIQLRKCAPRAAAQCKELVRVGLDNPESEQQEQLARTTFEWMMAPGSEGQYGIEQFQNKRRDINWAEFWATMT